MSKCFDCRLEFPPDQLRTSSEDYGCHFRCPGCARAHEDYLENLYGPAETRYDFILPRLEKK